MSELVACKDCGSVHTKPEAADLLGCPACGNGGEWNPVPKHGRCKVWWREI